MKQYLVQIITETGMSSKNVLVPYTECEICLQGGGDVLPGCPVHRGRDVQQPRLRSGIHRVPGDDRSESQA